MNLKFTNSDLKTFTTLLESKKAPIQEPGQILNLASSTADWQAYLYIVTSSHVLFQSSQYHTSTFLQIQMRP